LLIVAGLDYLAGLGLVPSWNSLYALAIAARGILTDRYDAPQAASAFDYRENTVDLDNTQPFPIYGYINVGWQRIHFGVDLPPDTIAGQTVTVVVRALDPNNNLVPGYRGTVHFTSTDLAATLPLDYTFSATDAGQHTWTNDTVFRTAGVRQLT